MPDLAPSLPASIFILIVNIDWMLRWKPEIQTFSLAQVNHVRSRVYVHMKPFEGAVSTVGSSLF